MLINEKGPGLYGYIAFYNGKQIELYASSLLAAVTEAAKHFKTKTFKVSVHVAESPDGLPIFYTPDT